MDSTCSRHREFSLRGYIDTWLGSRRKFFNLAVVSIGRQRMKFLQMIRERKHGLRSKVQLLGYGSLNSQHRNTRPHIFLQALIDPEIHSTFLYRRVGSRLLLLLGKKDCKFR